MPAPQQPQRETSSAPRCNKMVQGDGIMSYTCSLSQGHEVQTSDPADPQPCYTVESSRAARVWQNWSQREHDRTRQPAGTVIQCPTCSEPSMRVTEEGGRCENCGATAEIQQDLDAATFIGEQMLPGDGTVAAAEFDTSERDADIIAAAKAAAPEVLEDGCLGEHDPATSLRCSMRPAPPAGYALVEVGPQPLRDEQVPDWLLVADGSPNPTAEQVQISADLRKEFEESDTSGEWVGYRVHFDNDSTRVERYSIPDEVEALRGKINAEPAPFGRAMDGRPLTKEEQEEVLLGPVPTKQREGDQVLPKAGVDCVQDIVIAAMQESKRVGTERYGQPLMTFNGRKGLQDIVDEARDFFVYGTMLLREGEADRETLVEAVTKAINSADSGMEAEGKNPVYDLGASDLAEIAVDTVMGWVVAQRAEPVHVSGSLTERLDRIEEVLRPLGIINRAVALHIDGFYVDKEADEVILDPEPMLPPVSLQHLLALVEQEFPQDMPSVDSIAQWPEEIRYEVQKWATAVHLVASDNDMEIPQMPEVLR
jgi:hypothetical protein